MTQGYRTTLLGTGVCLCVAVLLAVKGGFEGGLNEKTASLRPPLALKAQAVTPSENKTEVVWESPRERLRKLKAQVLEAHDSESIKECILQANAIAEKVPDSVEAAEAWLLKSECLSKLGEHTQARKAYLEYVEITRDSLLNQGALEAAEALPKVLLENRLKALVDTEKNYLEAAATADAIVRRYPGTDAAQFAQYVRGRSFESAGELSAAEAAYKEACAMNADAAYKNAAQQGLKRVYTRAGRNGLVAYLDEQTAAAVQPADRAQALYAKGLQCYQFGAKHYPQAIEVLSSVVQQHPDSAQATNARKLLKELRQHVSQ